MIRSLFLAAAVFLALLCSSCKTQAAPCHPLAAKTVYAVKQPVCTLRVEVGKARCALILAKTALRQKRCCR